MGGTDPGHLQHSQGSVQYESAKVSVKRNYSAFHDSDSGGVTWEALLAPVQEVHPAYCPPLAESYLRYNKVLQSQRLLRNTQKDVTD